ncbi:MAG: CBS domain-containing protein [Acidimicrobiales bacterium]|jgi:CBS domain-containing protein|nr:CBS domain-containing protein [Acidimicrobiales bacterium]MDP6298240.1 CBS domain-containing protein [Acidimicrobiales bacterium]HJM29036.1 CBS domain-containing protein [Acidimicrobiales bacterium]HJM98379.1 CBS domain-containing protein [Acidimicrobiales bacterium]
MTDQNLQHDIDTALVENPQTLWGSRLIKRSLFDADGSTLGSIQDLLLVPSATGNKLYLRGFLALVNRRLIFVHEARVDAVDRDGLHLRGGTLDLRLFKRRPGEFLLSEDVYGAETDGEIVRDVGFSESGLNDGKWLTNQVAFASGGRLRRKSLEITGWGNIADTFSSDPVSGDLARLRELHKADAAEAIQAIPEDRRSELTAALEASRLADLLEELPESEQAEILNQLDTADAIEVLEEMEIDDEIDLLKELEPAQRETLLAQMDPDIVRQIRSLLSYNEDSAGGMMTPEAIVLTPESSVADAIARLRDTDLPPAISVRLFVAESPTQAPTGKFLGSVTLPRLLREPPTSLVGDCIDRDGPTLQPNTSESEVAALLARYDLLAVAVVDSLHRLVGVVTVDDVIIRLTEGVPS